MTEQQIQQLKKLLENSSHNENSTELDHAILGKAQAMSEQRQRLNTQASGQTQSIRGLSHWFATFGFMRSAALSVALTVAVFWGLNKAISVDHQAQPLIANNSSFDDLAYVTRVDNRPKGAQSLSKFDRPVYAPGTSPQLLTIDVRDQILAEMEFPETQRVLDSIALSLDENRMTTEAVVVQAMTDIKDMIREGQLNNARDRYNLLLLACGQCALPDTLEALVLNLDQGSSSG